MKETKSELILKISSRKLKDDLITPEAFSIAVEHRAIDDNISLWESYLEGLRIINFDGEIKEAANLVSKSLRKRLGYELGISKYTHYGNRLPI